MKTLDEIVRKLTDGYKSSFEHYVVPDPGGYAGAARVESRLNELKLEEALKEFIRDVVAYVKQESEWAARTGH